jgi:hypothetical protein
MAVFLMYRELVCLGPFMMFLSILGLSIAWRWERLGGTIVIIF